MISIAFDRPGGEPGNFDNRALPINLAHLNNQTMGDRMLEREVLVLFAQQASLIASRIQIATPGERKKLARSFKGAAMAVGAVALADCASSIGQNPDDLREIIRLTELVDDVRAFVARFTR